jgi:KUP system potassium uptake protein
VLSAVEGLEVAAPTLAPYVMWISLAIVIALFMVQRFGTARVGIAFGPLMLVWFIVIAALGIRSIASTPSVLLAIDPQHAVRFFVEHGKAGFLTLGAVVLCITGGEALYADMGHFGKRPIRLAWFGAALPALLLNYFGQGALLLRDARAAANPFYLLSPTALRWPLIILAAAAAVVASQALISGAFSLTQQSVQLGYSPRMQIIHTSETVAGQIYIPEVNNLLMIGCALLILGFKNSSNLSAAYGIAVTGTMAITTILFALVARTRWDWSPLHVVGVTTAFLAIDLAFLAANVVKIEHGGWVPIAIALVVYALMSTWKLGRLELARINEERALPLDAFLKSLERRPPLRASGTAVFMTSSHDGVPVVLLHHLKHNKVLHEHVVLLSVQTRGIPHVKAEGCLKVEHLAQGFHRVVAQFGFMDTASVPEVLKAAEAHGIAFPPMDTSYFLGRERLVISNRAHMWRWRKKLFAVMSRNARSATEFFQIPSNRVVELGAQIEF